MLAQLKTNFYNFLIELGFNATDNAVYEEKFPWLMVRTNNYTVAHAMDTKISTATLVVDIFSNYPGEKEIIEIVEKIEENLQDFESKHPEILYTYQRAFKILDDKNTGIVRKHGVIAYEFLMGGAYIIEEGGSDEDI